jgi:hypothetical protein
MNNHDLIHRAITHKGVTLVALVLVTMTLAGVLAAKPLTKSPARAWIFVLLLLGCTLTWWRVNSPLEGRVFFSVSYNHGFTLGDTLGLPSLVVSAVLVLVAAVRRRHLPEVSQHPPRSGVTWPNDSGLGRGRRP